jgi:hypothetical protein
MNEKLSSARSDDCGSLRDDALDYCMRQEVQALQPPIPKKAAKSGTRGFKHAVLGRLLCPAKYLDELDENSEE